MKILVTGGVGFIGSNFIRYMLTRYDDTQTTINHHQKPNQYAQVRNIAWET